MLHTDPMEQNYHFIRNTIKLLGITLLVYAFMKWLLPMVLPFFVAFYLAGAFRRSACRKKEHKTLLILRNLLIVGGVCLLLWYLVKEFMDLWGRREELLYWEGAKESGLFGEAYEKLMAKFNTEQMLDHFVDNVASPFGGMQDTLGGMVALAVTLVATILMTKDYALLQEQIKKNTFGQVVVSLAKELSVVGGDYLRAQGIIMLIITAICIVALLLTGNSYAVLVGVFIGFCDALPFIGTSLIFLPWAVVMFLQKKIGLGIYYLFLAGGTSLLRQYLEPKLIGRSVGADPLIVLACIYLGLEIYGIWGVILGPASAFLIWEIYRFT